MGKYRYKDYDIDNVSILREDTRFNGQMSFKNPVQVLGEFSGSLQSDSILIISKNAVVNADVTSRVLILEGVLKGDVRAAEKVDILSSGKLYGNITTAKLKIADGVVFDGTCTMIKNAAQEDKAAS